MVLTGSGPSWDFVVGIPIVGATVVRTREASW